MGLIRCMNGHLFSSRRHGNFCPYCNMVVNVGDENYQKAQNPEGTAAQTYPYLGEVEVMDPVTGWLVCIEGPNKGRDYRIMTEKNFIGRAEDMHIQILGDNHIARRNHAVIVYDPKKRKSLLLPGDASGLVYCNSEAIYTPQELNDYDIIEMGKSKFLFISLCGEHFEWKETEDAET